MKTINFGAWSPRDFAANTLTGGGLNFSDTRLAEIDGEVVFEMFNRKNIGHRTKFIDALEDAVAGNKYRISLRVKLGKSCSAESAEVVVGVTDPLALQPAFLTEPKIAVKNEWTTFEFVHTITDDSHSAISVEQTGKDTPIAENILVGNIETEILHKEEKKEESDDRKTLWLIGDSITCPYPSGVITRGWGMYIGEHLDSDRVKVKNLARCGLSTKSYIHTDGLSIWSRVCERMRKGDFLIVSLGINDFSAVLKERKTSREEYADNLRDFADEAHRLGASLLFVTSTVTINNNPVNNFRRSFLEAMIEVANEKKAQGYDVSCIDLNAYMFDEIRKIEAEKGYDYLLNTLFSYEKSNDGTITHDTTHHSEAGSRWVASMISELVAKSECLLKEYLVK